MCATGALGCSRSAISISTPTFSSFMLPLPLVPHTGGMDEARGDADRA